MISRPDGKEARIEQFKEAEELDAYVLESEIEGADGEAL